MSLSYQKKDWQAGPSPILLLVSANPYPLSSKSLLHVVHVGGRLSSDGVISNFWGYPPFSLKRHVFAACNSVFSEANFKTLRIFFDLSATPCNMETKAKFIPCNIPILQSKYTIWLGGNRSLSWQRQEIEAISQNWLYDSKVCSTFPHGNKNHFTTRSYFCLTSQISLAVWKRICEDIIFLIRNCPIIPMDF